MSDQSKTVLITGASAGIGKSFAEVFFKNGFNLVLTARRMDRLESLRANLMLSSNNQKIDIISADLSDEDAPKKIFNFCIEQNIHIDALVNNAGYGNPKSFEKVRWDEHSDFIQVMIGSVTELIHIFLPGMINKRYGRIINVASLAPYIPPADRGGLYSPVKIYQIKLSEGIHYEYMDQNIFCTALCPGLTRSEFHIAANMPEVANTPDFLWMSSERVAEQGYKAVMSGKNLIINGWLNKFFALISMIIPKILTKRIGKYLTKKRMPK
mgnify:FL=1|tara:strand:- start:1230 stop:2033 length:804 start_codon:yes stop_codon:yes gene_type:complete